MRNVIATTAALLLPLAACGGGSEAAQVDSAKGVAEAIGCSNYEGGMEQAFTTEGGSCRLAGSDVFVYYFAGTDARKQHTDMGTNNGATYLVGDNWSIEGERSALEKAQEKVGGELAP